MNSRQSASVGAVAAEIGLARDERFQPVERVEEWDDGSLVGGLSGGEPRPVNSVVQSVVDPGVHGIDVGSQRLGIEVTGSRAYAVESRTEDADDVGRIRC